MTQNRRIVWNTEATYGIPRASQAAKRALCGVRSLYALAIALFCGWWTVMGSVV